MKLSLSGILYWLSLLLLALVFVSVFGNATGNDIDGHYINSDTLYLPSLFVDVFENGNSISDWNLNPAPNFFPDMFFYFILMKLTGSLLVSSFLYSILQIIVINLLFLRLLKRLELNYHQLMVFANLGLSLFALVELISDDFLFVFYILSNSYHTGSFVLSLIALNSVFGYLKSSQITYLILLFFTCLLGYISDQLFVIGFVIPFVFSFMYYVLKTNSKKSGAIIFSAAVGGLFSGSLLLKLLTSSAILQVSSPNSFFNFENSIPGFFIWINQYLIYIQEFNFISLIIVLAMFSFCLLVFDLIKNYRSQIDAIGLVKLFFLLAIIIGYATPIIIGNYTGIDTIRYNFHFLIVLIILLPIELHALFNTFKTNLHTITSITFSVSFVVTLAVIFFSKNDYNAYFYFYPEKARKADLFYSKTGLKYGTADYWDAKLVTMFSRKGVILRPTFNNLIPWDHVCNKNWFFEHPTTHQNLNFQFTAIDSDERITTVKTIFPNSHNQIIWIEDEAYLPHPTYLYAEDYKIIAD